MVQLTRLNHLPLVLNSDLIEYIEITPRHGDYANDGTEDHGAGIGGGSGRPRGGLPAIHPNGGVAFPILSRDQQEGASLESEPA
jgi:hypothetical protein